MEPQEYYLNKGCFKNKCIAVVIDILLVAFFTVIGLIIGASVATALLEAMAALITLAVTFGVLLIISIVFFLCNRKKKDKNNICC